MLFPMLYIIMALLGIVNATCSQDTFRNTKKTGLSRCVRDYSHINGFYRNGRSIPDELRNLKSGICCNQEPRKYDSEEVLVVYANWSGIFNSKNVWAKCPTGYYLQGIYSDIKHPISGLLNNIKMARCSKPAKHPLFYSTCYIEKIDFNKKGRFACGKDYFVAALYKGDCNELYCLEKLYCCQMEDPQISYNVDILKTKIMEQNLKPLANLASLLGYRYCSGVKSLTEGEDFYRDGDSWVADTKLFPGQTHCNGHWCDYNRLSIDFTGWSLAVKEIIYGDIVTDELAAEAIHTGAVYNKLNASVTKTFEYSKTVMESITHSTTSTWKTSQELSISLDFSFIVDISMSFTTNFEYSKSSTNENNKMSSILFKASTTHEIQPNSAAQYTVIVGKSRTTIPYTAIIIAKFRVTFRGILQCNASYHFQYKEEDRHQVLSYTFGDKSEPFYAALRRQSNNRGRPWLFKELLKDVKLKNKAARYIETLTNEKRYEFKLKGKLERVVGSKIDVIWDKKKLNRRSTLEEKESEIEFKCPNSIFIAETGPNDKPAEIKYPQVDL